MPNPLVPTTIGIYVLNLFEGRIKRIFYGNKAIENTKIDKSVQRGGGGGDSYYYKSNYQSNITMQNISVIDQIKDVDIQFSAHDTFLEYAHSQKIGNRPDLKFFEDPQKNALGNT